MITTLTARILGQRIRQLRTRRGLTQQDLAGDDYSKSYISAIEQGKTRPSLEALQRIAARLEVPAGTLLDPEAQGFAPFDAETMPRRVRRRRGARNGGQGMFEPAQIDIKLAEAEIMTLTGRAAQSLHILRPLIPEEATGVPTAAGGGAGTARQPRHLDVSQVQRIYFLAAQAAVRSGDSTEAVGYLQKGMQYAQRAGDVEGLERMRNLLGMAYYNADQPLSALEHHRTCMESVQAGRVRDPNFKLSVYSNIARDYAALHDNERALSTYKSALDLLNEVNNIERQAEIFWDLSGAYAGQLDWTQARTNAIKAVSIYEAHDNMQTVARLGMKYGDILVETGDLDAAEGYLTRSLELAQSLNSDSDRAVALTDLALLTMKRGDLQTAAERADQAVEVSRGTVQASQGKQNGTGKTRAGSNPAQASQQSAEATQALAKALAVAGEIATQRGDNGKADKAFAEAIEIIEKAEAAEVSSDIYQRYAHVLASRGQHEQASRYFERAYKVVTKRK
jgi:tetratricopeptide (TPR) repeat protein/DNA-binding XRE family transcriptional regulator